MNRLGVKGLGELGDVRLNAAIAHALLVARRASGARASDQL